MEPEAASDYHLPVLPDETIQRLAARPEGRYVDGTAGGGGHLILLLDRLGSSARVLGLDRDPEAIEATRARIGDDGRVTLRVAPFSRMKEEAERSGMLPLDGILLDLGVSSRQLDDPAKGFTYRVDAPLDMRMDPGLPESAADLLARLDGSEIADLLRELGEVRHARSIAREIVRRREDDPLRRSGQLREAVEANTPPPHRTKVLSQVFQALRIAVNDEMGELDRALETSVDLLAPGGRLVVIAYHSLEDRRVKRFMREASQGCTCPPDLPVCVCGADPVLRLPERRAVKASDEEVAVNPRARSARLRWAERTSGEARR